MLQACFAALCALHSHVLQALVRWIMLLRACTVQSRRSESALACQSVARGHCRKQCCAAIEAQAHPECGYLGGQSYLGNPTLSVQYWRSFDALMGYARCWAWRHAFLAALACCTG